MIKLESFPHIPMLHAVMMIASGHSFTEAKSEKLESNYSFKCLSPKEDSAWTVFSRMLAQVLNTELVKHLEIADKIIFDDLYLTSYPKAPCKGALGVGPHRDTNCKGLIAVVILTGELPSYICRDKDTAGSVYLPVRTGEMLLMRAEGCGNLPKPLHYVGEVKTEAVIQFGMRQYINPNWKNETKKDK